jgi:protein-L-isoaspartate(D-aspartate) O-methyltransferase
MGQYEPNNGNGYAIALNQALIDELKNKGYIRTSSVEAAFRTVLRHLFVPGTPLKEVYSDQAIQAKKGQDGLWLSSSSQPAIMAIMLEQLGLEPGHRVLEIGTGTGYNAALMAHIVGEAGRIVTVDIDKDLAGAAREHLAMAGFERVQVVCADGGYGYPDAAPYDRVILTVGAPDITPAWWDQMGPGGRMVLPLTLKGSMASIAFERVDDHLASISVRDCSFIPLRGDYASMSSNQIQLGPDPALYIEPVDQFSIDGDAAYRLLTGMSKDWAAGVEIVAYEAMMGKLRTWLALHEPQICQLVAEDDMVERNIVPSLMGIGGKQQSARTIVLLDKTGLAALMRSPGQSVPLVDIDELFAPDSPFLQPFSLFVRQFGSDESIARRLITQIQAWDAAGRPSAEGMHIRVYPKGFEYTPSRGEFVIEKQWTRLVLEWPEATQIG